MVLDHADPAGQHAVIQDAVNSLEHPRTLPDTILDGGLVEKISDWEPAASPVPEATLDGRLMEGTTYLEHLVLGVSLDSGLMEGTSSPEPLEQSVLNTLSTARPEEQRGYQMSVQQRGYQMSDRLWHRKWITDIRIWNCRRGRYSILIRLEMQN